MLSVILTILKIIGIIILALLALILLIILCVLFIPIRYKLKIEHGDAFILDGGISWFFHIIHAKVNKSDNNSRIWVRVFGFLVYDSLRTPKPRNEKIHRIKKTNNSNKTASSNKTTSSNETTSSNQMDSRQEDNKSQAPALSSEHNIENPSIHEKETENNEVKADSIFIRAYKKIKAKLIGILQGIKNKINALIQKLLSIKKKTSLIIDFINNDVNKEGFKYTYLSLKKLIKHILPRKLKSRLIFGTGDPSTTGKALGVFGFLYGIYGDNLQITPNFEEKVFEGNHYVRGRIRTWTILIIVIKLLLDKRFKELKMNYQQLKEAL